MENELEKAAENEASKYFKYHFAHSFNQAVEIFKAGAEWQKEQDKKEIDRLNAYIEDLSKGYEQ